MHFQLYYGNDIPDMQIWKQSRRKKHKKTKKKIIKVKKPKKTEKETEPATESNIEESSHEETASSDKSVEEKDELGNENMESVDMDVENEHQVELKKKKSDEINELKDHTEDIIKNTETINQIDPETGEKLNQPVSYVEDSGAHSDKDSETKEKVAAGANDSENSVDQHLINKEDEHKLLADEGSEYEDVEIDVTDSEVEEEGEPEVETMKRKLPKKRDLYNICKDNGIIHVVFTILF